jgi:hypothetical protein
MAALPLVSERWRRYPWPLLSQVATGAFRGVSPRDGVRDFANLALPGRSLRYGRTPKNGTRSGTQPTLSTTGSFATR